MMRLSLMAIWNDARLRGYLIQTLGLLAFALLIGWFVHNAAANMARMGITSGFGFLSQPANFAIGETMVAYHSTNSYGRAILVGLLNTVKIAALTALFATLLGTLLGILRLSANPLLRGLVQAYVEMIRNVPLLLQLFFWYSTILIVLPSPRQALNPVPGVFLSNRGFRIPWLDIDRQWWVLVVIGVSVVVIALAGWVRHRRRLATGQAVPVFLPMLAVVAAGGLALKVGGASATLDMPALKGFNFSGGVALTPEFGALLFGLTIYTSAFISEIVRSGISSISTGQREAARSLGLKWWQMMRLVVLPQALRIVVPPLTSTYMTLTKNSSLAVAIGYPDLVSVVNTTMNQTGQAVEAIAILMVIYLSLAISISIFMNWYNRRVALKER